MYIRLTILTLIILSALTGLTWLGDHAINMLAEGLEEKRNAEFAEVGQQIRLDVMQKLDKFMKTEQDRPFTDYQDYFIPNDVVVNDNLNTLNFISPIGQSMRNGLAFGHFQLDTDSNISAPYYGNELQNKKLEKEVAQADIHFKNIRDNLIPILNPDNGDIQKLDLNQKILSGNRYAVNSSKDKAISPSQKAKKSSTRPSKPTLTKSQQGGKGGRAGYNQQANFPIPLQNTAQETQIYSQSRAYLSNNATRNITSNRGANSPGSEQRQQAIRVHDNSGNQAGGMMQAEQDQQVRQNSDLQVDSPQMNVVSQEKANQKSQAASFYFDTIQAASQKLRDIAQPGQSLNDLVQIRVEPFVQLVVEGDLKTKNTLFDGQIFLLRHVQVEDDHFIQGFQLDEKRLIETVRQSARLLIRHDMDFELSQKENLDVLYSAILDFDFGNLYLHLKDTDPLSIANTINRQRYWYFSIITVVFLAVMLGMLSIWRNMAAQVKLAHKKDDFISAVSHELRTPLTSIRMFTEMLEKNWVKTEEKRQEYYQNMRQETERLSRLIENVLDFSRIQKKRKKFNFQVGDINQCICDITDSMCHYAKQSGFTIKTDLADIAPVAYDKDAVMQILINLIDNAIKYAQTADDKSIIIRSASHGGYIFIDVEDHGPGIPNRQHKKVFDEFYRCQNESTRETTGTGLGLALVNRFAQAHNGFVEILNAKPTGTIFRVKLAIN